MEEDLRAAAQRPIDGHGADAECIRISRDEWYRFREIGREMGKLADAIGERWPGSDPTPDPAAKVTPEDWADGVDAAAGVVRSEAAKRGANGPAGRVLAEVAKQLEGLAENYPGRAPRVDYVTVERRAKLIETALRGLLSNIQDHHDKACPGITPADCLDAIYEAAGVAQHVLDQPDPRSAKAEGTP